MARSHEATTQGTGKEEMVIHVGQGQEWKRFEAWLYGSHGDGYAIDPTVEHS